ncbi:MAG: hypothetical protein HY611_06055, partial [Elusimicrobia bacterium]|nr:hypothetical protein [Elusimicrobiota bacterium]
ENSYEQALASVQENSGGDGFPAEALNSALKFDLRTLLPNALLMKVDKSTMNASIEARVPYLDHRLVEWSYALPAHLKIRRFRGKHILRTIAGKYLPRKIVERRKHGFIVPWEEWLLDPKNKTPMDALCDPLLKAQGIFQVEGLRQMLEQSRRGRRRFTGPLWSVIMLSIWLRQTRPQGKKRTAPARAMH